MSVINSIPLIAAGDDGYKISRSVRFRSSASAYLNRTFAGAGNTKTWTWSGWVKRGVLGAKHNLFGTIDLSVTNRQCYISFEPDNTLTFLNYTTSGYNYYLQTTQVFRDPSAWYHIVCVSNTSQATAANRLKIYVNGVQVTSFSTATYPSQNFDGWVNANTGAGVQLGIGRVVPYASPEYFDGYMTEMNFIDGQALTPSSFGETNAGTGVWQPKKYMGTYGTNGFYLNFSDNSGATATTIGKDNSGNGNNFTPNNISVTAGVTYDSMLDSPTPYADGGNGRGNYCVLNPLNKGANMTLSSGNLNSTASGHSTALTTFGITGDKWYMEYTVTVDGVGGFGVTTNQAAENVYSEVAGKWWVYDNNGNFVIINQTSANSYSPRLTTGSVVQCAIDYATGKVFFGVDNVWISSTNGTDGDPVAGANPTFTISTSSVLFPFVENGGGPTYSANFGQRPFAYTPPSGFKALNTLNLPAPTISNGGKHMNAITYTGTGASVSRTGVGFQPDLVWYKSRSVTENHQLFDSVRGVQKSLYSNLTNAETTDPGVYSFDSDGFTAYNSAYTYVAWNWNAGGSTVTNTDGSISAQVRANPTAGFSVCTFNVGASGAKTFGHGLGVAPKMVIVKSRTSALGWCTYHASATTTTSQYLQINLTSAVLSVAGIWGSTLPTSTLVGIGSGTNVNVNDDCVAYCFAAVAGYSAFGSYTGNGSADGPFVYLGFRPRFVMWKRTDAVANWFLMDSSRTPANPVNLELYADQTNAEVTFTDCDFLSNGFKLRTSDSSRNASGGTYVFAAFAENPFKNSLAR